METKYDYLEKSPIRFDAEDKVSGTAYFTDDYKELNMLFAAKLKSIHAHAIIKSINTDEAVKQKGVIKVLTGADLPYLLGIYLGDTPVLARDRVRYFGEPVAVVIAKTQEEAQNALSFIKVEYEKLPYVENVTQALKQGAFVIHPKMNSYSHLDAIHPLENTNIANINKIKKGNVDLGFVNSKYIAEVNTSFPSSDHVSMEPRVAIAKIKKDGTIIIRSSTQAPFVVRNLLSKFFNVPISKIIIQTSFVGGGYGGKAGIQLEGLAYLLSKAVGGRPVRLINKREDDMISSPGHIGCYQKVKIGISKYGNIQAMSLIYHFDSGAYADYAVNISRAAAIACSGPYNVENLYCESLCVYTNHPFATAFRGFGHEALFGIERALDILAEKSGIGKLELRYINAIKEGDYSPTMQYMDENTGNLEKCISKVANMLNYQNGDYKMIDENTVRTKGISSFWKAPAMPTNTDAGAILTFNEDGSLNLSTGIVEIGQGSYTSLAQIAAEILKIPLEKIKVNYEVSTLTSPHDWATAASRSLFMAGKAVIIAANDMKKQLFEIAKIPLRCAAEDLILEDEYICQKSEKKKRIKISEVALGYVYPNGNAIGNQIIGRGAYLSKGLSDIDQETGKGSPALEFTIGVEGVEIELSLLTGEYKVIKAVCAIDAGTIINPNLVRGQIVGSMAMALSNAINEEFIYDSSGKVINPNLRDYKLMRFKDAPEYQVKLVNTEQKDGPFGARGVGEQGFLGIYGALANALSCAIKKPVNTLPFPPSKIYSIYKSAGEI